VIGAWLSKAKIERDRRASYQYGAVFHSWTAQISDHTYVGEMVSKSTSQFGSMPFVIILRTCSQLIVNHPVRIEKTKLLLA
jgi:hypothetical protein